MGRYLLKRLLQAVVVWWATITIAFVMLKLTPGDPFSTERALSPQVLAQLEAHYGLDQPAWVQYLRYFEGLFHGDFGPSYTSTRSVNEILGQTLPVSLELGAWALLVALAIGLGAGTAAALKHNRWPDYTVMSFAMLGICLPTFVLGPIFQLLFGVQWRLLPVSGWFAADHRILPAITLGLVYGAIIARVTRGGMLEVLSQDFLKTARAKGLPPMEILLRHTLRGGLLPTVSYLGPAIAGIVSGSFVIETIFQIPGLGRQFVQAALNRDLTLVLGTVTVYATLITLANLLVDLAVAWLDPRVRSHHA
ncbi:MAG: peptide/nickel transport system permease protein [Puniceicoccaceae bacterium 5H]|nr:MAG: peptide/nickel transport system permease protein [Puniceicoccaceae bacterium 5H]